MIKFQINYSAKIQLMHIYRERYFHEMFIKIIFAFSLFSIAIIWHH